MICPYPEWLLWFFIGTTGFFFLLWLVTAVDGWKWDIFKMKEYRRFYKYFHKEKDRVAREFKKKFPKYK